MDAVHEETRMTRCLDGDVGCLGEQRCLTHDLWHALGGHIAAFLANVTLQEVLDGIPREKLENFDYRYTALFEQDKPGARAGVPRVTGARIRGGYFFGVAKRRRR